MISFEQFKRGDCGDFAENWFQDVLICPAFTANFVAASEYQLHMGLWNQLVMSTYDFSLQAYFCKC